MGDKANVGEVFPFHDIRDCSYVGVKIYVLAQEVRAICQSGKRERIHLMALLFESVRNATPIPSSAKGTGNQNKRLARGLSTRATDRRIRRNYRGRAYSGRKTADHSAAGDPCTNH